MIEILYYIVCWVKLVCTVYKQFIYAIGWCMNCGMLYILYSRFSRRNFRFCLYMDLKLCESKTYMWLGRADENSLNLMRFQLSLNFKNFNSEIKLSEFFQLKFQNTTNHIYFNYLSYTSVCLKLVQKKIIKSWPEKIVSRPLNNNKFIRTVKKII